MPIKIQSELPAKEILEHENIFVMDEKRALHQDIRPVEIVILNLMPVKQDTELQLLRALSDSPLQVNVTFLNVESHISKNTSSSHMNQFYTSFAEIKNRRFDGMIITGAPVEQMEFEEVDYWEELKELMDWSETNTTSCFHICWGAQAALYHHFGISKKPLPDKLFGVYEHRVMNRKSPIVRGFDDIFLAPHSRYTTVDREDIIKNSRLKILAESNEAGVLLVMADEGKKIFIMGHLEYDRVTLHEEYMRDKEKGLNIQKPYNYYRNGDESIRPYLTWRAHCNNLYTNWLNYYVYQTTPYDLGETSI